MSMDAVETPLRDTLRKLAQSWGVKAAEKGLELELEVAEDFPQTVAIDALRLQQALSMLLSNAVKFTDFGQVLLRARRGTRKGLTIEVADMGPGLPQELIDKVFLNFAKTADIDPAGARSLLAAKRIVEHLGGSLTVSSTPGIGAVFRLRLPHKEPAAEKASDRATALQAQETEPAPEPAARTEPNSFIGLRVLAADDNPLNLMIVETMLEKQGCKLTLVEDGAAALKAAMKTPFDVIFLDLQMPVMTGIEAARRIRRHGPNSDTPIVALTASTHDSDRTRWREAGAAAFLPKPVDALKLMETMNELVGRD